MEQKVKLTLEGFGNRSLSAIVTRDEVEGKKFEDVINMLSKKEYTGEDAKIVRMVKTQMDASGGYTPFVGVGTPNSFKPIRLNDSVKPYIQPAQGIGEMPVLRTTVSGVHVLG